MRDPRSFDSEKINFYVDESMGCPNLESEACVLENQSECSIEIPNLNEIPSCNPALVLIELCALLELMGCS